MQQDWMGLVLIISLSPWHVLASTRHQGDFSENQTPQQEKAGFPVCLCLWCVHIFFPALLAFQSDV